MQHIAAAGQRLYGEGTAGAAEFLGHGRDRLLEEGWAGVCRLIGEELAAEDSPGRREAPERFLGYSPPRMGRIDYAGRLASGEAIGSGVVEGAANRLGLRLKARVARWKRANARLMAALICCRQAERWELFWKSAA